MSFNLTELDPTSTTGSDKLPPITLSNSVSSPMLLAKKSPIRLPDIVVPQNWS